MKPGNVIRDAKETTVLIFYNFYTYLQVDFLEIRKYGHELFSLLKSINVGLVSTDRQLEGLYFKLSLSRCKGITLNKKNYVDSCLLVFP